MRACDIMLHVTECIRKLLETQLTREKTSSLPYYIVTGAQGITSTIVSLFQKCRRLCHLRIKQKVTVIAPVDVAVSK